jgi:TrmH family RNA methyltransferase
MLSKAKLKYIRSLSFVKYRNEHGVFVAEGEKIALEWLNSSFHIKTIICTSAWAESHPAPISKHRESEVIYVKDSELEAISSLKAANEVVLIVSKPAIETPVVTDEWALALEDIRDPGNMGTIIRIADWFGIRHVICSPGCVDVYSSKVVQSAMGGHLRVSIYETGLAPFLKASNLPKLAATLDGENVYNIKRMGAGILLIGNESSGLSDQIISLSTRSVTIPRRGGAESLNAAVSAGILCALLLPC